MCVCCLPGGNSSLGTRNFSGLNGEMVATAGLCLWAINKDSQVDCKGLRLVFELRLGFCSLVSVLSQLLHRF